MSQLRICDFCGVEILHNNDVREVVIANAQTGLKSFAADACVPCATKAEKRLRFGMQVPPRAKKKSDGKKGPR